MKKMLFSAVFLMLVFTGKSQWKQVSNQFGLTTESIQLFEWEGKFNDSAFIAYYVKIKTTDKKLVINTDTTLYRRFTPKQFYDRLNSPTVVVNASFFEFKNKHDR